MDKQDADYKPPLQSQMSAAASTWATQDMQSAPSLTGVVPTMCGSANHESTAHTSLFVPNKASTAEQKQGAKHGGFAEEFPHTALYSESATSTTSGLRTLALIAQAQGPEARDSGKGGTEVLAHTKTNDGEPTGQSRDTKLAAETSESPAGGIQDAKPEQPRPRGRPRGSRDSQPRMRRSHTIRKPGALKKGQAVLSGYPWMMYGTALPYGYPGYVMDDYVKSLAQWGQMQQGQMQHPGQVQQGMMQQGMMLPRQTPQPLGGGMDLSGAPYWSHGAAFHQSASDLDDVSAGGNHFPLAYQAPGEGMMWPGQQIPGMMGFNAGAGAAGLGGQEPRLLNNTGNRADQSDQQGLMYWATKSVQQQLGMPMSQDLQGEPSLKITSSASSLKRKK